MRLVTWNLEKKELARWAVESFAPDIALFQEWVGTSQTLAGYSVAFSTSFKQGDYPVGTAVYSTSPVMAVRTVMSPYKDKRLKFWLGGVYKATTLAQVNGLTVVSFHGYNGWSLFGRDPTKLVAHVQAVAAALPPKGPVVWAGDFNTFSADHVNMVDTWMQAHGFAKQFGVPYDAKKTLDWVYTRGCTAKLTTHVMHLSDHPLVAFDLQIP